MNSVKVDKLNQVREEITAYLKDQGYTLPMITAYSADNDDTFHLKFVLKDETEIEDPWNTDAIFEFEDEENFVTEMETLPNRVTELEQRLNNLPVSWAAKDEDISLENYVEMTEAVDNDTYLTNKHLINILDNRIKAKDDTIKQLQMDLAYLIEDYSKFKKSLEPQKQRITFTDSWMLF